MFPRSLAFFFLCSLAAAKADTVSLSPSADTGLFEYLPGYNWGAEPELVAGVLNTLGFGDDRCRILMKFDVHLPIPAGSTITAASLTMSALKAPSSPANANFQLMRLFVPWEEGTKDGAGLPGGASATTGETTWNHRFHTGTTWGEPGGKLEFDFAEDPSGSVLVSGQPDPGPNIHILNFNADGIADLNSMLDFPSGNHGWVFLAQNETTLKSARRWASSEHPTYAPVLEIEFTPPPPPPPLEIFSAELDQTSGSITLTFGSIPGRSYTVQTRADLDLGTWVDTVNVSATNPLTTSSFTAPAAARRLFFRVVEDLPEE